MEQKKEHHPIQFYAQSYSDFKNQFVSFLKERGMKSIFFLTDGVFKKSSLESGKSIEQIILKEIDFPFSIRHMNLSHATKKNPEEIHAGEFFLEKIKELVSLEKPETTAFVSLGSGTITDLLKHALHQTHDQQALFISMPTALTVTAYTSSFSVIDIQGAKRTRASHVVDGVFWIEPLLQAAPMAFSRAGYGDLLAHFTAYADWYLGHQLGISKNYDETAHHLMLPFSDVLRHSADDLGQEYLSPQATKNISSALGMAGIAMNVAKETTPLSGYEHAISHALDFLHLCQDKNLVLHGEQVALSCLSSCMSFDWLLEQETFDMKNFRYLDEIKVKKIILKMLNQMGIASDKRCSFLFQDYVKKNSAWIELKENFPGFLQRWPEVKSHLKTLVISGSEMETLLKKSHLPYFPESAQPPTPLQEFRWALRFSPFIRSRFALSDFLFWIGEDPCHAAAV